MATKKPKPTSYLVVGAVLTPAQWKEREPTLTPAELETVTVTYDDGSTRRPYRFVDADPNVTVEDGIVTL